MNKSGKTLILGIILGIVAAGSVFIVITQTGLLSEEDDVEADDTGENVVDNEEAEESDSESDNTEQEGETLQDVESFAEEPSSVDGNDINEDGTFNSIEDEVTALWETNGLMPVDGDSSEVRDLKDRARITAYEDYLELKENGVQSVEQGKHINLGSLGFSYKGRQLFKNNEIVDIGDIKIVGAHFDTSIYGLTLNIENNSDGLIDKDEITEKIQYRFKQDYGAGTDWMGVSELVKTFTDIEMFNNADGSAEMNKYLGRGLTDTFGIVDDEEDVLYRLLDTNSLVGEDGYEYDFGGIVTEDDEDYQVVSEYQNQLPDVFEIEIKYGDETVDYEILKSREEMYYNYEEAVKSK